MSACLHTPDAKPPNPKSPILPGSDLHIPVGRVVDDGVVQRGLGTYTILGMHANPNALGIPWQELRHPHVQVCVGARLG